jgi:hypothetical protein
MKYLALTPRQQSHLPPQPHSPRIPGTFTTDYVIADIHPALPTGFDP